MPETGKVLPYLALMAEPRITRSVLAIFAVLRGDVAEPRFGMEIAKAAGLSHTTIYDTLARMEAARWLQSEWESTDAHKEARPRRRMYRLTPLGEQVAIRALENEFRQLALGATRPGWITRPRRAT